MLYALTLHSLKAGACLAVFYLFFKLLLSRETFHRLNRIVVLGATALSFVLPLCVVTVYREAPAPIAIQPAYAPETLSAAPAEGAFPWDTAVGLLFLAGVLLTLGWTFRSLLCVVRIIRNGRCTRLDDGCRLITTGRPVTPFSWGRCIVISERDYADNGAVIVMHERAHIRLRHSWDLLATDLLGALQWFNPAMWLLRRELRAIHEYEADEAVLDSGVDARQYQLLLIKKAAGGRWYSVANSFNHSKLKNRITMMLQKRSSRWAGAKALLVVPLAGIALGAFAETVYVVPDDKDKQKTTKSTTVVVSGSDSEKIVIRGTDDPKGLKPLYVVDGKEVEAIDGLDPAHIANVSVLKTASAVEQYGERAKDGVIIITTRSADAPAGGEALSGSMRSISVSTSSSGTASDGTDRKLIVVGSKSDDASTTTTTTTTTTTEIDDSGKTTASATIRITGNITVKEGSEFEDAFILIDGKESTQRQLSKLDSGKIEEIQILKGKAAEERYGEKGAHGVVIVTTKKK